MHKKVVRKIIFIAAAEFLALGTYILYNLFMFGKLDQAKLITFVIIVCGLSSALIFGVIFTNTSAQKHKDNFRSKGGYEK
ncbi:MAG: hypothetical protein FJZ15_01580 [Candidatus Omnitrophica bacterium]|nr:hypothetical protein [Candidatus Omnitrophota bacterium]